ncbi:acetylglutamate kinase [Psychrobacillus insolitus]|nr:acetylglutamate kinase [Psychrobacillus insolitus]
MTMSKSTQATVLKRIVVKLGGSMLEGLNDQFFMNFKRLQEEGNQLIIVHGGGPAINKELARNNVTSTTINGIRVTSKEAVGIVQSTLIGKVNPALVHELNKDGIVAVGLSGYDGQLLECTLLNEEIYGFVGEIQQVNTSLLDTFLQAGVTPVIACIGCTADGHALNINGDTVASEIALAMKADSLLLVTDTPGIKINDVVQEMVTQAEIDNWIETGDIFGGMIPKVQAAVECLQSGIPSVQIVGEKLVGTVIISQEVNA